MKNKHLEKQNEINDTLLDEEKQVQDAVAKDYENIRYKNKNSMLWFEFMWKRIFIKLDVNKGESILDAGVGIGKFEEIIGGDNFFGIDFSKKMLVYAKKRLNRLAACDVAEMCFKEGSFDKAFCIGILHHMQYPEKGVSELARVLKGGGRIVIAETNKTLLSTLPRKILNKYSSRFSGLHKNFTKRELCAHVEQYFIIEKIEYLGYIGSVIIGDPDIFDFGKVIPFLSYIAPLLIKLDLFLSKIPIINTQGWGIIISARKI